MEERIVIVAYQPKKGREAELHQLMLSHYDILSREGLASERKPVIMQAKDGTVIEVFGWKSEAAMRQAHNNAAVTKMWQQYAAVCDYIPVAKVPGTGDLFSSFAPIN